MQRNLRRFVPAHKAAERPYFQHLSGVLVIYNSPIRSIAPT